MTTTVGTLEDVLRRCREEGRAALVGYLPVGYPTVEGSIEAMKVLVEAGCDVVEVGIAYSDPVIDGPVNQEAMSVALAGGATVDDVFTAVTAVREAGAVPVVMTCGQIEENVDNNRLMTSALQAQGYDTRLVENRDVHTYVGWRDTFDPHLVDLLQRVLQGVTP